LKVFNIFSYFSKDSISGFNAIVIKNQSLFQQIIQVCKKFNFGVFSLYLAEKIYNFELAHQSNFISFDSICL
jgi:hypothetical protein